MLARRAAKEQSKAKPEAVEHTTVNQNVPRTASVAAFDVAHTTDAFQLKHSIAQEASPAKAALVLQRAIAQDNGEALKGNATWAAQAVVDKYLAAGQFAEAVATVQHVLNSGLAVSPQLLAHLLTHLVRSAKSGSDSSRGSLVSVSTAAVRVVQSFRAAGVQPSLAAWHALLQVFAHFGMPPVTAPWAQQQHRSQVDSWLPRKVSVSRQRRVAGDRSAGAEHAAGSGEQWTQSSTVGSKIVKAGSWEAQGGMLIPRDEHSLVAGPTSLLQGLATPLSAIGGGGSAADPAAAPGTLGGALESSLALSDEEATAALLEAPPTAGGDPFGFGSAFAQAAAASSQQQEYGASALPSLPVAATPLDYSPSTYPPGSSFAPSSGQQRRSSDAQAARAQAAAYSSPHHVNDALGFLAATWGCMGPACNATSAALLMRCLGTVPSASAAAADFLLDLAQADGVPLNTEVQCAIADIVPTFASPQAALALLERCVRAQGAVRACADDIAASGAEDAGAAALGVRWDVEPRVFGALVLRLLRQEQYMAAAEALDAALEVGVLPPPRALRGVVAVLPALSRLQIVAPSRKQQLAPVLLALRADAAHAAAQSAGGHTVVQAALSALSADLQQSSAPSPHRSAPDAVLGNVQPAAVPWGATPAAEQEPSLQQAMQGCEGGVPPLDQLGLATRAEAAAMEADAHTDAAHVLEAVQVLLRRAAGDISAECGDDNHLGALLPQLSSGKHALPPAALVRATLRAQGAAGNVAAVHTLLSHGVAAWAAAGEALPPTVAGAAVAALADAGEPLQAAETAEALMAGELHGQAGAATVPAGALRRVLMAVDDVRDLPAALKAYACIVAQGGGTGPAEEHALQQMCLALIRSNKPVPPSMVRGGGGDLGRFSGYFNAPQALSKQLAELQAAVQPAKVAPPPAQHFDQLHEVDLDRARALSAAFDAAKLTCTAIIQWLQASAAGVPACPVKDVSRGWEDLNALESSLEAQLAVAQSGVVEEGDAGAAAEMRSVLAATLELLPLVIADCPSSASAHARRLDMSRGRRTWVKTAALRREQLAWSAAARHQSSRSQFAAASSVAAGEAAPLLPRVLRGAGGPAAPQAALGFDLTQPRLGVWVPDAAFAAMQAPGSDGVLSEDAAGVPAGGLRQAWYVGSGRQDARSVGSPHVAMLDGSRVPLSRAAAISERQQAKAKSAQHTEDGEDKAVYLDEHDALRFAEWDRRGHAASSGRSKARGGGAGASDDLEALLQACRAIQEARA